jgi:hypothetical protein
MTKRTSLRCLVWVYAWAFLTASCAPKYGCPTNGKNVGAERILESGKSPKAKKMKV